VAPPGLEKFVEAEDARRCQNPSDGAAIACRVLLAENEFSRTPETSMRSPSLSRTGP